MELRHGSEERFLKLKSFLSGTDWFLAKARGKAELGNRGGKDFKNPPTRIIVPPRPLLFHALCSVAVAHLNPDVFIFHS